MEKIKLGDVASVITKGTTPTSIGYSFIEKGINFIKIESISEEGKFIKEKLAYISEDCHSKLKRSQLKENDILFSIAGAIGRVAVVDNDIIPANTNQALAIIRIDNRYDKEFLAFLLRSSYIKKQYNRKKQGVAQINLSLKDISELEIPVIDIKKQIEIKETLKKIIEIITLKKGQIEKLDNIVKSQFVEMFGDININDKKWNEDILKNNLSVVGGYAFKSSEFQENGIPILRIGNINTGQFRPKDLMFWKEEKSLENYAIYPDDVLMSLTGTVGKEDYGNICIIGNEYPKYYLNQRNAKLNIKETLKKEYISYALRVPEIKRRLTGISRGVRQANISNKDIENLKLPIPPIELQNQFADFVKKINKQKFEIESSLREMQELYEALMERYFG